jgi:hypothetical protein
MQGHEGTKKATVGSSIESFGSSTHLESTTVPPQATLPNVATELHSAGGRIGGGAFGLSGKEYNRVL